MTQSKVTMENIPAVITVLSERILENLSFVLFHDLSAATADLLVVSCGASNLFYCINTLGQETKMDSCTLYYFGE